MPCFNVERYLGEAVQSILGQTFEDFELIAVDDGSTDATRRILEEFSRLDSRVRVATLDRNYGAAAARNEARGLCRGEFVAVMDSDDISYPHRLAHQVAFLDAEPGFVAVGAWLRRVNGDGSPIEIVPYPDWSVESMGAGGAGLSVGTPLAHGVTLIRRTALDSVGWYRQAFRVAFDADLWRRLLDAGFMLANLQEVLLDYRWHGGNVSVRSVRQQSASALRAVLSQRMRHAGLPDPFDALSEPPLRGVVADWGDFPLAVRAPVRVRWVQRLARAGGGDPGELVSELVGAVSDAGWDPGLSTTTWFAVSSSLSARDFRGALTGLRIGLRHDPLGLFARAARDVGRALSRRLPRR